MIHTITSIMTLLDKHNLKGLAMLPALFLLFSCEEPSEIGLNINPNQGAISTHFVEIPVETSQIKADSVRSGVVRIFTQNASTTTPVYIGRASDPVFGALTAKAYTNIGVPTTSLPTVASNAGVDSIVMRLAYDNNFVGEGISEEQSLHIYQLLEAIEPTSTIADVRQYNYQIFNSEPLGSQIGTSSFDTASVKNKTLHIPLNKAFGTEILDQLKADTSVIRNQQAFNDFIGGLAVVPGQENTFLNNYLFPSSRIDLYYGGKTTPISFPFLPGDAQTEVVNQTGYIQFPTYYELETDFSGTPLENAAEAGNREEFQTADNQLYFRSGVGLFPKISFPALEDFFNSDTLGNYIINQVVLEIDSVTDGEDNRQIPRQVHFYFVNENNARINGVTSPTRGGVPLEIGMTVVNGQDTVLSYTNTVSKAGEDLLFLGLNQYIQTQNQDYLQGFLSNAPDSPNSLLKFIAEPEKIKLGIYYTTINSENN